MRGDGADTLVFDYAEMITEQPGAYQVVVDLTKPTPLVMDAFPTGPTNVAPVGDTPPFSSSLNTYEISGFETVVGGPLNDWMRGGSGTAIAGGPGPDCLDVGAGNVTISYATSSEGVEIWLYPDKALFGHGDAEGDVLANWVATDGEPNLSGIVGSTGDDTLLGFGTASPARAAGTSLASSPRTSLGGRRDHRFQPGGR